MAAQVTPQTSSSHECSPVALITGAGSGIGRAITVALAGAGMRVALVGRRDEALRETSRLCIGGGLCIAADVAAPGRMRSAVDEVCRTFGRLDVLVNNAGVAINAPIAGHDEASVRDTFGVNASAPAIAIAAAWPVFERQRCGCVINISSMASVDPFPGFFAYAASKAALNMLTRIAADEGKSIGVRAFAICPGAVETPMLRSLFDTRQVPAAMAADPSQVAALALACVRGEHDDAIGEQLFLPSP